MTRREAQLEDRLRQCGELLRKERETVEKLRARLRDQPQPEPRTVVVEKAPKGLTDQLAKMQRQVESLRFQLAAQRERLGFLLREFEKRRPLAELWTTLTYEERKMAIRKKLRPRRASQ